MIKAGDTVYYDNGNSIELIVGEGIAYDVVETDRGIVVTVVNYKKSGVVCDGVLGVTFFETEEDLRRYFGRKERKKKNYCLVHKATLVLRLNEKFPNLITDEIRDFIFELPDYNTEIDGEKVSDTKKCSVCGQALGEIFDKANYCYNCGTKLF